MLLQAILFFFLFFSVHFRLEGQVQDDGIENGCIYITTEGNGMYENDGVGHNLPNHCFLFWSGWVVKFSKYGNLI